MCSSDLYLQAFGHVVLAWVWLELGLAARATAPATDAARERAAGLLAALRFFHLYELPKVDAWLGVVASREAVCREMRDSWF